MYFLLKARAKLELREVATVDDANDILEIFGFSLSSVFDDEVHAVSALSESVLLMDSTQSSGRSKSVPSQVRNVFHHCLILIDIFTAEFNHLFVPCLICSQRRY